MHENFNVEINSPKVIHIHLAEEVKIQIKEQSNYIFHEDKSI